MHWVVLIGVVLVVAAVGCLLWRWRSKGRLPRRWVLLWAAGVAVFVVGAVNLAHAWLPGAVDVGRQLLGFEAVNAMERVVFTWLDRRAAPDRAVDQERLLWSVAPSCLEGSGKSVFRIARQAVDPTRPDVQTTFIAMDTRALSFDVMLGGEAPGNAVAAFNGGFQAQHGRFGIRSEGKTQIPAKGGLATLGVGPGGQAVLWTWSEVDVASYWRSFRQNLAPLLDAKRTPQVLEELTLVADGQRVQIGRAPIRRSGLCRAGADTLIYVWSKRATARTLGDAMRFAGCDLGMHLDANTFHTRFEFMGPGCTVAGAPGMTDGPLGRYRRSQDRDFFVVTLGP